MKSSSRASVVSRLVFATAALFFSNSIKAASDTWSGATDGNWSTLGNWGSAVPGATTGTTNTDTATFNTNPTNRIITIDSGRVIQNITFDTSAGNYTIGSAGANGGNTLKLAAAGTISITSTVTDGTTETFNAALSLVGSSYTISNLSTGTASLTIAGNISAAVASSLTIQTATTTPSGGLTLVSGNINDGAGVLSVNLGLGSSGSGRGNVEFTGANSYSGQTNVDFDKTAALGTGMLTTSGTNTSAGTTLLQHGTLNLNNATNGGIASGLVTFATGNLRAASDAAGILSNALSITNSSSVDGSHSLTFNGDFTNATTGKTLTNSMIAGTLTFNGKLNLGTLTTSGSNFILTGTGTTLVSGVIQDYSGGVGSAAGSLTLNPVTNGLITLSGANTYTGATLIYGAGKVFVSTAGNSGSSSNLGSNGTINIGSANNAGTLVYTGTGETSDKVINLAGTTGGATLDQSGASGNLKFTSALTATGAGIKTFTLQGSTAGTGEIKGAIVDSTGKTNLTKLGTGTWTLSGNNSYTGATTVSGGTLVLDSVNGGSLSATTPVTIGTGGNFAINGSAGPTSPTVVTLASIGTSSLGSTGLGTNAITLNGGVNLSAATFTSAGLTLVRGNRLGLDSVGTTGSTNITFTTAPTLIGSGATGTATVGVVAYTMGDTSATGTGTGFVTYDASTGLRLLTAGETTGTITAGSNVKLTSSTASATVTVNSLEIGAGGGITGSGTITIGNNVLLISGTNTGSTATINRTSTTSDFYIIANSDFTASAINNGGSGTSLYKLGAGTVTINGSNDGGFVVDAGTLAVATGINKTRSVTVNGGTFKFLASSMQIANQGLAINTGGTADFNGTTSSAIILSGAGTITNTAGVTGVLVANSGTFSGNIASNLNLSKVSASTLTLSGANTYTGTTTVSAGTLAFAAVNSASAASNLVMSGGTLATGGFNQTLGTLTLTAASTIDLGSGASALVFSDSSTSTWTSSVGLSFVNFDAGIDSIRIGTSASGLTSQQLSQITLNGLAAYIDSNGFLTTSAIPESSTLALLAGAGVLLFVLGYRSKKRLVRTT